jgi:type VI secretion system secreted protein Hcp
MATPIFGWFEGTKQGLMKGWGSWPGEDDVKGREDSSLIYQFDHEITVPRNPQSGLPSGHRVHHPVRVIKRKDKASPLLYQALCTNERFVKVEFKWFRANAVSGRQEHYFTTLLEDSVLVEMKDWFPITVDKEKDSYSHMESLAFTYRKIHWTWLVGGTVESYDDWKEQS